MKNSFILILLAIIFSLKAFAGKADTIAIFSQAMDTDRELHQKLLKMGIEHDYAERPGEHTWDFWKNAVVYQLLYFHRFFNGITDQTIGK